MEDLQQTGAILLVLGLLASALYVLKKKKLAGLGGDARFGVERRLQVLERVILTPQHTLCLVRVGDRVVMVTTAPGNCQVTETFTEKLP